ncbi:DUF3990 domain-containing protein [Clostridium saccharobutylicum]|uniref:DUF3990 domain-containing protein n=1 Tax=Clostridium saccharobutylicum TaxID=169679 RepID=UPI00241D76D7|nr:DUF3990 domain-containing protein [Clostridium saccharobutylicum]
MPYTTTLELQSKSWAENMFIRYGGDGIYVMKFKLKDISNLNIKEFKGLDEDWLNMIKNNRLNGGIQHDYDVVIGPVADDNTMRTVALYVGQDITLDIIMKIEKVVRIVCERTGKTFEEVTKEFYESRTYKALQNTESVLWAESSEFIVDELFREWENK